MTKNKVKRKYTRRVPLPDKTVKTDKISFFKVQSAEEIPTRGGKYQEQREQLHRQVDELIANMDVKDYFTIPASKLHQVRTYINSWYNGKDFQVFTHPTSKDAKRIFRVR